MHVHAHHDISAAAFLSHTRSMKNLNCCEKKCTFLLGQHPVCNPEPSSHKKPTHHIYSKIHRIDQESDETSGCKLTMSLLAASHFGPPHDPHDADHPAARGNASSWMAPPLSFTRSACGVKGEGPVLERYRTVQAAVKTDCCCKLLYR